MEVQQHSFPAPGGTIPIAIGTKEKNRKTYFWKFINKEYHLN